jgi:hypothetical protein
MQTQSWLCRQLRHRFCEVVACRLMGLRLSSYMLGRNIRCGVEEGKEERQRTSPGRCRVHAKSALKSARAGRAFSTPHWHDDLDFFQRSPGPLDVSLRYWFSHSIRVSSCYCICIIDVRGRMRVSIAMSAPIRGICKLKQTFDTPTIAQRPSEPTYAFCHSFFGRYCIESSPTATRCALNKTDSLRMQFGEHYTFTMQVSANPASPRVHEMNKSPISIEIEDSVLQPNPCDPFSYSHTILPC